MEEFNKRLTYLFEKYSLTASTFADKIGVQRSSLSHIISGRNKPSLDFILKIYEAFPNINLPWLTLGEGSFSKTETNISFTPISNQNENEVEIVTNDLAKNDLSKENILKPDDFISNDLFSNNELDKKIETEIPDLKINVSEEKEKIIPERIKTINSEIEQVMIFYKDGTFKTFYQR